MSGAQARRKEYDFFLFEVFQKHAGTVLAFWMNGRDAMHAT
jgi:hypothetical protein